MSSQVEVFDSASDLAIGVAERIAERLSEIAQRRDPSLVLTGGTIAGEIYRRLDPSAAPWSRVDYYFGDERYVPAGHIDRNDREAAEDFLTPFGVPAERIHQMPAHDCALSLAEAADDYAAKLPAAPFDLTLLGVGPDAHIASLFPGFTQLSETNRRVVEVFGSPKPPAERITLTLPVLNNSDAIWLLVSGAAKAEAVAASLAQDPAAPAALAAGIRETVWFIDRDAASAMR
jgi:6-phosphogluconolactonase